MSAPVYGHVISMGTACWTSQLIKDAGLKRFSCPFDWIFSSPAFVGHCLEDDFGEFLSRDRWVSVGGPQQWTLPVIRDRYGLGRILNHHDASSDADFGYLTRSVDRFRAVLAGDAAKIFLLISEMKNILDPATDRLLETLSAATSAFKLVCVGFDPTPAASPGVEQISDSDRRDIYRLHPGSVIEDGLRFKDARDNQMLQDILGRYEIRPQPSLQGDVSEE